MIPALDRNFAGRAISPGMKVYARNSRARPGNCGGRFIWGKTGYSKSVGDGSVYPRNTACVPVFACAHAH
jgi:hypothetical protein